MGLLKDLGKRLEITYTVQNNGSLKWLTQLSETCSTVGIINENNNNVEVATYDPEKWLPELIPYIIENVDYVTASPTFEMSTIENGKLYSTARRVSGGKTFNTIEEVKDFLKSKKYKIIALYYIINHVDLETLKKSYIVRYAEWEDVKLVRKGKLKEIMD